MSSEATRSSRPVKPRLTAWLIPALGIVLLGVWMSRPGDSAGPCAVASALAMLPELPEASGLAISRSHPGILWSHNDSGNRAVLFALDTAGGLRGRVRVPVSTRDWEDISAGRCPSGDCLYIADIGDNRLTRQRIEIYRVPEPAPGDAETEAPEVFSAAYTDGPHNAEALFVLGEELFIITRDRTGRLYRSTVTGSDGRQLLFEPVAHLRLEAVTDAEASSDEETVVVRTSHEAVLYRAADLISGRSVPYLRVPLDGLKEPQGEGVALDGSTLYLTSEGTSWNRAGRLMILRCQIAQ